MKEYSSQGAFLKMASEMRNIEGDDFPIRQSLERIKR